LNQASVEINHEDNFLPVDGEVDEPEWRVTNVPETQIAVS
jgi:hypothetical protein